MHRIIESDLVCLLTYNTMLTSKPDNALQLALIYILEASYNVVDGLLVSLIL